MSLGLSKMSSENKQFHSYENVQAPSVSSHENTEEKRQHKNHEEDYINVQFEDRNGRRHLAVLGETSRHKESGIHTSFGAVISTTESTDGTVPQHELAKSNRQELKHSTESKTWRVYSRTDSDSSSSDIADENKSPDDKKREVEHYNRLKLNLSCPPRNKKALKGIKILINAKQSPLQVALHTSKHFKRRQQLSILDEPSHTSTNTKEKKQTVKYRKEGHINHLLSVQPTSFEDSRGAHPQDN